MVNKTEKIIYVNKYDYMHYYTRCKEVWFLSSKEILDDIEELNKKLNITTQNLDVEESHQEFDDSVEISINEQSKEDELNEISNDENKEKEDECNKDPKLIEGQIIDKKARDYIKSLYQVDTIIDYDDEKYSSIRCNNYASAQQVKHDIEEQIKANKTFIMFQPTFVCKTSEGCNCATKCDCIVYIDQNKCYLIEVKGSSSTKVIYLLDLLFQKNVVDNANVSLHVTNYFLCLVAYTHAVKGSIPFVISKYISLSKNGSSLGKDNKNQLKSDENEILDNVKNSQEIREKLTEIQKSFCDKNEEYKTGKHGKNSEYTITDTLNAIFNESNEECLAQDFIKKGKDKKDAYKLAKKYFENYEKYYQLKDHLITDLTDILKWKKRFYNIGHLLPKLKPCPRCTSQYKDCDYWSKCQALFSARYFKKQKKFFPYIYSGNVFSAQTKLAIYQGIENNTVDINNLSFLKENVKEKKYLELFNVDSKGWNRDALEFLKDKLFKKSKRVYFDFESIDPAIVPVTGIVPLNHVITQNSIIKTTNYYVMQKPINMLCDPMNIDLNWFKSLVDALYEGQDAWYIVYNKTFEANRLHEIDMLIADPQYHKKIKCICDNIFDLVDFFNTTSFQEISDKIAILPQKLHGYYTIKKVINDLVPQEILDSVGCYRYNDPNLSKIHKGDVAKDATSLRYLSLFTKKPLISEDEWNDTCNALKKYCENDVRAMIAVEKYIEQEFIDKMPKQ